MNSCEQATARPPIVVCGHAASGRCDHFRSRRRNDGLPLSRNLTALRLGAPIWQVQLNLPLVCLDSRSGRYLGRKATYPSWIGLRYDDLDPEPSIAQRYDAVDRLSVRMQPGHLL